MNILDFTKKVESFAHLHQIDKKDVLLSYTQSAKLEKELIAHQAEMKQERILKIGVIGRVKAGKSSLLNMLFFEGRNVLPKAATPMTAALTCLRYGEKCKAEIDCFSAEDIAEIKKDAKEYLDDLKVCVEAEAEALREKNKTAQKVLLEEEILKRAKRTAERSFKNHPCLGAYEQAELFRTSAQIPKETVLEADNPAALMDKLRDYVGSDGKYMPYTKSVVLYLPEEGLKGIEVVDTPGVDDPVKSREERTNQFLKNCNVVLTVLPLSQFINDKEVEFIEKTMTASGVQECYLIGSRFDDALIESASGETKDPSVLIRLTIDTLSKRATDLLTNSCNVHFKEFVGSSSIAFNLLQHIDYPQKWESLGEKVWDNLKFHFPEIFNNKEKAKVILAELTGRERITQIIEEINQDKQRILDKSDQEFENKYKHQLKKYLSNIERWSDDQIQELNIADEEKIMRNKASLERMSKQIKSITDDTFGKSVNDFSNTLKDKLENKNSDIFKGFRPENSAETKEGYNEVKKYRTVKQSGVSGGVKRLFGSVFGQDDWGYKEESYYEREYYNYKVILTGPICDAIDDIRQNVEEQLAYLARTIKAEWQDEVVNLVGSTLNQKLNTNAEAKKDLPKPSLIETAINNAIYSLPDIPFKLDGKPEKFNCRMTIRESEGGNTFVHEAKAYIQGLEEKVNKMIESYVQEYKNILHHQDIGLALTEELEHRLGKILSELKERESKIKHYNVIGCEARNMQSMIEINV